MRNACEHHTGPDSKDIGQRSRPANDLSLQDEQAILDALSGDWDAEGIQHYCVRGACPLKCNGREADALKAVQSAVALAVGGKMEVPLQYRWKGVEKANAWCFRGRKLHNLLSRAIARVWPERVVRQAQLQVQQARDGIIPDAAKTAMRASSVLKWMHEAARLLSWDDFKCSVVRWKAIARLLHRRAT